MNWGFGHGQGAAVHMFGRYARLRVVPNEQTRQRLLALAEWVDAEWEDKELPIGIGVENFPDERVFGHREFVDVTVAIGLLLNDVVEDRGPQKVAGLIDAHRKRVRGVPATFWEEAASRLGTRLGTVARPTSVIDSDNPLRDKDELLLVHASDGLGCRYSVGVEASGEPELVGAPRSIKSMRRGKEAGIVGYHLWVETTTQLSIRDTHRKKMAEALRKYGKCGQVFSWIDSVSG